MNLKYMFNEWGINPLKLTEKKQQTDKKIEYVRDYAIRWAEISAARDDVRAITFIDCMCNAGVYRDGDCCTAIEVLKVFCSIAERYPQKTFRVLCNDNDREKIYILKKVITTVKTRGENVHIHTSRSDVNAYLDKLLTNPRLFGSSILGYGCSTILYVDPFDFGTVEIPKISAILEKNYCELIFNFFISDYVRNINTDQGRIQRCLGGRTIKDIDELLTYVREMLRVGRIKHLFSYDFRSTNNVELYQIVFATPSTRGLEVLKESLWKVFNGAEYHRNQKDIGQTSLFTAKDDQNAFLDYYSREARVILQEHFSGQTLHYTQIEEFLIERTMLGASHIIGHVLKPMIASGEIVKCGMVSKRNFKGDQYIFVCNEANT